MGSDDILHGRTTARPFGQDEMACPRNDSPIDMRTQVGATWISRTRSPARDWTIGVGVVLLMAIAGYGFLLAPGKILFSPYSDIFTYHLAAKEVLFRAFQTGHGLAFWRADQLAGTPAFTNPNILATHPLQLLFYVIPPAEALGWTIWLHLAVGAVIAFYAATVAGLAGWPRLFVTAAALFSFKVIMAVYAGWLSMLPSIIVFPLLMATVVRLVQRPGLGTALAAGAAGALSLHGGLLQLVYYCAWFLMGYLALELWAAWRRGDHGALRRLGGWAAGAAALALGLSAYILVPLAAEAPLTTRSDASYQFLHAGHVLGLRHLLTFLWPEALGTPLDNSYPDVEMWEDVAYFGVVPLVLAGLALILGRRRPWTLPLGAGFLISIAVALTTPLHAVLYVLLPGFRLFRHPGRILFLTAFFGILLAGIGLAELQERVARRTQVAWLGAVLGFLAVLLVAGEGTIYARRYLQQADILQVLPHPEYARSLQGDGQPYRVTPVGRLPLNYGWAAPLGLELITGYEPFNLRHYQDYLQLMQWGDIRETKAVVWTDFRTLARWDLLDSLNARYFLSLAPLPGPASRLELVARFPGQPIFRFYQGFDRADVFVYRNPGALPRAYWADRVIPVRGEAEMLAAVRDTPIDRTTLVEADGIPPDCAGGGEGARATVVRAADGQLVIDTQGSRPGFLVISEIWHPGWRATLDGRRLHLSRVNLALMGACIPAGAHRLLLEFRPIFWAGALAITLASAGVLLLGLIALGVRRWLQRPPEGAGVPPSSSSA